MYLDFSVKVSVTDSAIYTTIFHTICIFRYDDIFEERMAKFYIAEMTLAIQALHCMGYVHR